MLLLSWLLMLLEVHWHYHCGTSQKTPRRQLLNYHFVSRCYLGRHIDFYVEQ
jgi:hypothetical protein